MWDAVECNPLAKSGRSVVLIGSVFGALCVERVSHLSIGVVPYHVMVCFWMDSGVGVEWMLEENSSVSNGGWSGHEVGCVGSGG